MNAIPTAAHQDVNRMHPSNHHHAFPASARHGLRKARHGPGWWAFSLLRACGLPWKLKLPADLHDTREQVQAAKPTQAGKARASAFYTF